MTVARYTGDDVLVSAGLSDGERVATAGVSKLRDGEKVAVTQEDAK